LDKLLDFSEFRDFISNAWNTTNSREPIEKSTIGEPYKPDMDDLYFLYCTVRKSAAISVLEFGSGFSTLALALALYQNKNSFADKYQIRHPNPFTLMSVDASAYWMDISMKRIQPNLVKLIRPIISTPNLTEYEGKFCSFYENLPFFVPDVIYLDGPDPNQVIGQINGFQSAETHGFPMSADVLRIEHHLWPQTMIITDGRRANAIMLQTSLKRNWQVFHDPYGDRTLFRLEESPLGRISDDHQKFRLECAQILFK
jgi:hypothetical protein